MSRNVNSAILSVVLLSGTVICAHAQSNNIAALPLSAPATPAPQSVVVAPPSQYAGPNPGKVWSAPERQAQPAYSSQAYVGPALTTESGVDSE